MKRAKHPKLLLWRKRLLLLYLLYVSVCLSSRFSHCCFTKSTNKSGKNILYNTSITATTLLLRCYYAATTLLLRCYYAATTLLLLLLRCYRHHHHYYYVWAILPESQHQQFLSYSQPSICSTVAQNVRLRQRLMYSAVCCFTILHP